MMVNFYSERVYGHWEEVRERAEGRQIVHRERQLHTRG